MPDSEHRKRERRTFRPSAPPPLLSLSATASMPQGPPQLLSRSEPETRNGLSLAHSGPRFRESHSGVNGPGLLLRPFAGCFLHPFGLSLHRPCRFAPARAASPLLARCAFRNQRAELRLPLPLPFGNFTSLRIKAFRGICRPAARLPIRPISVRSPKLFLSLVPAPAHRSRSATFRRLAVPQTSWNLIHYAPEGAPGQGLFPGAGWFSSVF